MPLTQNQVSPAHWRHLPNASPFDHCHASMDGIGGFGETLSIVKYERRRDRERRAAGFFFAHENAPCLALAPRINRQYRDTAGAPRQGLQDKRQGIRTMDQDK